MEKRAVGGGGRGGKGERGFPHSGDVIHQQLRLGSGYGVNNVWGAAMAVLLGCSYGCVTGVQLWLCYWGAAMAVLLGCSYGCVTYAMSEMSNLYICTSCQHDMVVVMATAAHVLPNAAFGVL